MNLVQVFEDTLETANSLPNRSFTHKHTAQ